MARRFPAVYAEGEATSVPIAVVRETSGPTDLTLGAVADGNFLTRVAGELVGAVVSVTDISNSQLSDVATATFKGRTTAGLGAPEDLTVTQATALLNTATSGANNPGLKGLVPAPTLADITKVLQGDMTWVTPSGGGSPIGGTTAARPVAPAQYTVYWDTTIGVPVWYVGASWFNAAGVLQ